MLIIMLSNPEKGIGSENQKCDATNCFSLFHTIGSAERMNDTLLHLYTSPLVKVETLFHPSR